MTALLEIILAAGLGFGLGWLARSVGRHGTARVHDGSPDKTDGRAIS
jgi:hypothetical protein